MCRKGKLWSPTLSNEAYEGLIRPYLPRKIKALVASEEMELSFHSIRTRRRDAKRRNFLLRLWSVTQPDEMNAILLIEWNSKLAIRLFLGCQKIHYHEKYCNIDPKEKAI